MSNGELRMVDGGCGKPPFSHIHHPPSAIRNPPSSIDSKDGRPVIVCRPYGACAHRIANPRANARGIGLFGRRGPIQNYSQIGMQLKRTRW